MTKNRTLTELDLRENNISAEALLRFCDQLQSNCMLFNLKVEEKAKDIHAKSSQRHESFTVDTVDKMLHAESEGASSHPTPIPRPLTPPEAIFNRYWELVKDIILFPNRDNSRTMDERKTPEERNVVLNLAKRDVLPKVEIQAMLQVCQAYLRILVLEHCKLDELPPYLSELVNLEELYVGYNHLRALPEDIGMCQELRRLSFPNNRVLKFPDSFALLLDLEEVDAVRPPHPQAPLMACRRTI